MPRRRKGFTQTQSKLTSHRMRSATIGTHVPSGTRRSSRHMNAGSVAFSNTRRNKRATRGVVDTLLPSTATGENSSDYARRVSRRQFTQEVQRRARMRRILFIAICVVVAVAVAIGVGVATFFGTLGGKLGLSDSNAATALTTTTEKSYYTLVAAELDGASSADSDGYDAFALVRCDEDAGIVSMLSIPQNVQVTLSDGKTHQLSEATSSGDAAVISAVSTYTGVKVAHFVKIDAVGLKALVDALGGVEVNVSEDVDDPSAGDIFIERGMQTLDGDAALVLARATNFATGIEAQAVNQRALLSAVSLRLLQPASLDFLQLLDSLGGDFQTDMSAQTAQGMADALRSPAAIYGDMVPGYESTVNGTKYYLTSSSSLSAMMARMEAGQDLKEPEAEVQTVEPGSFTVTVRNGAGITGGASTLASILTKNGFDVKETGNTDTAVYSETLVIYNDAEHLAAANTVIKTLGMGRTVANTGYYTFDSDVLVVLGEDWVPLT